jgi:hypothetical protein
MLQEFPIRGVLSWGEKLWFYGGLEANHPEIGKLNATTVLSTDRFGDEPTVYFARKTVRALCPIGEHLLLITNDGPVWSLLP